MKKIHQFDRWLLDFSDVEKKKNCYPSKELQKLVKETNCPYLQEKFNLSSERK